MQATRRRTSSRSPNRRQSGERVTAAATASMAGFTGVSSVNAYTATVTAGSAGRNTSPTRVVRRSQQEDNSGTPVYVYYKIELDTVVSTNDGPALNLQRLTSSNGSTSASVESRNVLLSDIHGYPKPQPGTSGQVQPNLNNVVKATYSRPRHRNIFGRGGGELTVSYHLVPRSEMEERLGISRR